MLPKLRTLIVATLFAIVLATSATPTFAQAKPSTPAPTAKPLTVFSVTAATPTPSIPDYAQISPGQFTEDRETAIDVKGAIRAQDFLDWVLKNGHTASSRFQPIKNVQQHVVAATYALALLVIIGVGFLLMIRRNKDITLMKFLPLFIALMAYVFLSYPITKEVYALNERLMKYFMEVDNTQAADTCSDPHFISSCNLLHVGGFTYGNYDGERRTGQAYDESALNTLLLLKVTSWTYMSMAGILVLRQIILWFFIIVAPLLALLIPFPMLRNTAKIWVGEFFRWLLYGTLFAVFLRGLVEMWQYGIPMVFQNNQSVVYPTSVHVLLAGPNYTVSTDNPVATSLNNPDTYANYIVALIMLWVVIILPWLLLRIFRDMLGKWAQSDSGNEFMGQLGNLYSRFAPNQKGPNAPAAPAPAPNAPSPAGAGQALQLPFRQVNIVARDVAVNQHQTITNNNETQVTQSQTNDIAKLLGMQMPKLTDIARMEMNAQNMNQNWSNLQKLGNPNLAANPQEMQHIAAVRAELTRRAQNGDANAQGMLQAAQSAAAVSASAITGDRVAQGNQTETMAQGAQRASAAIAAATASQHLAAGKVVANARAAGANGRIMPVVNRVQSVSLNDYEEVKKMWAEHYRNAAGPNGGSAENKKAWIKQDIEKAENAVNMLGNMNPAIKQKGLEMVAALLPFLLLGGFSEQETITYLKAKAEAAKQVLAEMDAKESGKQEEAQAQSETVDVENKKSAHAEEHMAEDLPDDEQKPLAEAPQDNTVDAEAIENQLPSAAASDPAKE